jgi:hypothetical protein
MKMHSRKLFCSEIVATINDYDDTNSVVYAKT